MHTIQLTQDPTKFTHPSIQYLRMKFKKNLSSNLAKTSLVFKLAKINANPERILIQYTRPHASWAKKNQTNSSLYARIPEFPLCEVTAAPVPPPPAAFSRNSKIRETYRKLSSLRCIADLLSEAHREMRLGGIPLSLAYSTT